MNKKAFLLFLLLTPLIIIVSSTLAFRFGYSPEGTKNNGIFFNEFTDISSNVKSQNNNEFLDFSDGKWVFAIYHSDKVRTLENIQLMKQLNIALNRDINRVKRVLIHDKKLDQDFINTISNDFPRQEYFLDSELKIKNILLNKSSEELIASSYIFIIDPYGRLVMFFPNNLDPKKILKDMKTLI